VSGFPWPEIMARGLGQLRLSPRDFWGATLREIAAATPRPGAQAMPRRVLDQLLDNFPDET